MRPVLTAVAASALTFSALNITGCASTDYGSRTAGQTAEKSSLEGGLRYELGEIEKQVQRSGARNTDAALNEYVARVGCAIGGEFCKELRFYVIETSEFNASMAPNGMMLINTGLLLRLENEAELTFVMAHEFGHYFENHTLERLAAAKNASRGMIASMMFGSVAGLVGQLAAGAGVMDFSRDQEREADLFASTYAKKSGYDALAGVAAWENLKAEYSAATNERRRKSLSSGGLFRSHPVTDERIAYLRTAASGTTQTGAGADKAQYRAIIRPYLARWLEAEIAERDAGATLKLIERMKAQETDLGVLEYARGETLRARDSAGDADLAIAAYTKAIAHEDAPAAAWRQIGVLQRKLGKKEQALAALETYLAKAPQAGDAPLVASMIATLKGDGQ